ncbi:MAG TPA: ATP-dependent sacrificial sulfur transferase LarE [Nitrospinota bacterium]|jgi:uncharacterized protein|nr:ATP-dependent sacrificial sulfur transferase LarE [Nitrospinota bacterium]|tara:strand:+ start:257805 stop:258644 length:840 start_codon:yes stop_codon:yes gene_type:complete
MGAKTTDQKVTWLKSEIASLGSILVAFSGGVDSTYLLKICYDTLNPVGGRLLGVTANSSTYPARELGEAIELASHIGIEHKIINSEELNIAGYSENPVNRCYHCKNELFNKLTLLAQDEGITAVVDGSNAEDLTDYRPGSEAAREHSVRSLLQEAGLTKEEIRNQSRNLGLPTWNKPAFACLASRFPYGENITAEKLQMVDEAEQFLRDLGFGQHRVRHHGGIARIELTADDITKAVQTEMAQLIYKEFQKIGFIYIAVDLLGYRAGSLNEALSTLTSS